MIGIYIIIGVCWTGWLEYYTTNNFSGKIGSDWTWGERTFHIISWPLSLYVFIKNL